MDGERPVARTELQMRSTGCPKRHTDRGSFRISRQTTAVGMNVGIELINQTRKKGYDRE